MKFIVASSNQHKIEEFSTMTEGEDLEFLSAPYGLEVVENGETFNQNAFLKAKAYFKEFKQAIVADDSGLVVPALPDMLGVQSARFAPELKDYKDKNRKLIELIEGKDRAAYFICVLCFYLSPDEVFFFEGRVHGEIGQELQGEAGFGYDPVFLPEGQGGQSLAQIPQWKQHHSHRAKAMREALQFFKK